MQFVVKGVLIIRYTIHI